MKKLLLLGMLLTAMTAFANPPSKASLVALNTAQGQAQLLGCDQASIADYLNLAEYFVTQKTQTFCGVATTAMVLNSLGISPPYTVEYAPDYRLFTQSNVFSNKTSDSGISEILVQTKGLTLIELKILINDNGAKAAIYPANQLTQGDLNKRIQTALAKHEVPIINYDRSELGQIGGGHISPIAAYNPKTKRYLVMDVSRYKYPAVWVTDNRLYQAVHTFSQTEDGKIWRGLLIVGA